MALLGKGRKCALLETKEVEKKGYGYVVMNATTTPGAWQEETYQARV